MFLSSFCCCFFQGCWEFGGSCPVLGKLVRTVFLKLINNSSSLNKGNHDRDGVWISDLN